MKSLIGSVAVAALIAVAGPAWSQTSPGAGAPAATKMSQAECEASWTKLDTGGTGSISQAQATSVTDFKAADANKDGKLSRAEYLGACSKGLVSAGTGGRALSPSPAPSTAPSGAIK